MPLIENYLLDNNLIDGPNTKLTYYPISGTPSISAYDTYTVQLPAGAKEFISVSARGVYNYSSFWNGSQIISVPDNTSTAGYAVISADRKTITIKQSSSSNGNIPFNAVAI